MVFPPEVTADDGAGDAATVNIVADLAWANWVTRAFVPIAPDPIHILTAKQDKHWLRWLFDDLTLLTIDPSTGGIANDLGAVPMAS